MEQRNAEGRQRSRKTIGVSEEKWLYVAHLVAAGQRRGGRPRRRAPVRPLQRQLSGSHRTAPEHAQEGMPREETGKGHPVMTTQAQLEARLTAVETALREIQRRLATLPPAPQGLDEMIGACKDDPAFEEVMAFGRAFREAQPYPDDPGAPV